MYRRNKPSDRSHPANLDIDETKYMTSFNVQSTEYNNSTATSFEPTAHRSMFLILKSIPIVVMNVCENESFA